MINTSRIAGTHQGRSVAGRLTGAVFAVIGSTPMPPAAMINAAPTPVPTVVISSGGTGVPPAPSSPRMK